MDQLKTQSSEMLCSDGHFDLVSSFFPLCIRVGGTSKH